MNDTETLPPHSIEAEAAVLGCVIREIDTLRNGEDPTVSHCLRDVLEFVDTPDCFYDLRHRVIFSAMLRLHEQRKPIHEIEIYLHLQRVGSVESAGGYPYLSSLPDFCPAPVMAGHFAQEVLRFHLARRLIQSSYAVAEDATRSEIEDAAGKAQAEATEIIRQAQARKEQDSTRTLVDHCIARLERADSGDTAPMGIQTGYPDIDRYISGLKSKGLYIVAARPSVGKSALAENIVANIGAAGKVALYVTLEMGASEHVYRMIHSVAHASLTSSQYGRQPDHKKVALGVAGKKIEDAGHMFTDKIQTLAALESKVGELKTGGKLDLLVVDYLQLLRPSASGRESNREQKVAEISRTLKGIGIEFDLPVLALAQLNREVEKENREPRLTDLRESGQIEQDADVVIFLWRAQDNEQDSDTTIIRGSVAKNRSGPCGPFRLVFFPDQCRFESAAKT